MYTLLLSTRSLRSLKKFSKDMKNDISKVFQRIMDDPHKFKPLKYELKGYRRARIGKHRIIYRINEEKQEVFIVSIEHRKKVYQGIEEK